MKKQQPPPTNIFAEAIEEIKPIVQSVVEDIRGMAAADQTDKAKASLEKRMRL